MILLLTSALALSGVGAPGLGVAHAGYGDAVDGIPSPADRGTHLWTNAARMDPEAFVSIYPCAFDGFTTTEQTPQLPLLWNQDLGEAARVHSDDMNESGILSHNSSDGTPFEVRVARYYDSVEVGENVAEGYESPYDAVLEGWMCSAGHRANIMLPLWEELGTGVAGDFYTQDFGARGVSVAGRPIAMGAHDPPNPDATVHFLATFYDPAGPPAAFEVVIDGQPYDLEPFVGTENQGVWSRLVDNPGGCVTYYFQATLAGGGRSVFPETGRYGFGNCDYDDRAAGWFASREGEVPELPGIGPDDTGLDPFGFDLESDDDDASGDTPRGCDHTGAGLGWGLLALAAVATRRRAHLSARPTGRERS